MGVQKKRGGVHLKRGRVYLKGMEYIPRDGVHPTVTPRPVLSGESCGRSEPKGWSTPQGIEYISLDGVHPKKRMEYILKLEILTIRMCHPWTTT